MFNFILIVMLALLSVLLYFATQGGRVPGPLPLYFPRHGFEHWALIGVASVAIVMCVRGLMGKNG